MKNSIHSRVSHEGFWWSFLIVTFLPQTLVVLYGGAADATRNIANVTLPPIVTQVDFYISILFVFFAMYHIGRSFLYKETHDPNLFSIALVFLSGILILQNFITTSSLSRIGLFVFAFYLLLNIQIYNERNVRLHVTTIVIILSVNLTLVFSQYLGGNLISISRDLFFQQFISFRASGTFIHPNSLGYFSAACFVYLLVQPVKLKYRMIILIFSGVLVWLSGSRSALLSIFVALIAFRVSRLSLAKIVALATLLVSFFPFLGLIPSRVDVGRYQIWEAVRSINSDQTIWFGYGLDGWTSSAVSSGRFQGNAFHAHNQWLDVLFIHGWIGVTLFLGCFCALVLKADKRQTVLIAFLASNFIFEVPISFTSIDYRSLIFVWFALVFQTKASRT